MLTTHSQPSVTYLKDYQPPAYLLDEVFLNINLFADHTIVNGVLHLVRNKDLPPQDLILQGEAMELLEVRLDGKVLLPHQYHVDDKTLVISNLPDQCVLETHVKIKPQDNTTLNGLYKTRHNYCTQCESQGFRRITYFLDRSDVLTRYTVTISADKKQYPTLLSNGNLVDQKDLENGRHWVMWVDPFRKPSYLFALVAGDFDCLKDTFKTCTGRLIDCRIYVEKGNLNQATYAMESVKRAMKWDEDTFGREYDLDTYMIVAVSDFNMGAMENKGLNIFNDKYILAKPDTATDQDYINIESVIGHEYFHNWSGNRITVRDWFQITLKEGLTIFRDQSFTADMTSKSVKRIQDVNVIRSTQFAQDAGPMAHPIRPESYIEINNFYTVTVYNKGSEVIRMLQTLLGPKQFRQAMDLYWERYDGHAVTTEDFVSVMAETSKKDLKQFQRWYSQAGTPTLTIKGNYLADKKQYVLTVSQSCPPTPGQPIKEPFHIPVSVGLLDKQGKEFLLEMKGDAEKATTKILNLKEPTQSFVFENILAKPVPSLLRNFSAPVKLDFPYDNQELIFLMTHDSDGFNRWDASQQLACRIIQQFVQGETKVPQEFIDAFQSVLKTPGLEKALVAEMLTLPSVGYLIELVEIANIDAIYQAIKQVKLALATQSRELLWKTYEQNHDSDHYELTALSMGKRALKNVCLNYLLALDDQDARELAFTQFTEANNLTDTMGALYALNNVDCKERTMAINQFYEQRKHQPLLMDKWFSLQAMSLLPTTLDTVKSLLKHPAFDINNPNRVHSLIGCFTRMNYLRFHDASGSGYQFLTDQVLDIDPKNPQVAARILQPLIRWKKFDTKRQGLMKSQLSRIASSKRLSNDVYELVTKSLE